MANVEECSKISEFYNGKTIFITGGTGFIGKVLIEKILRCCGGTKRVYLLTREKRGMEPQERIRKMFDCKVFRRIKEKQPNVFDKVLCVPGCLESDNLGMSLEDYNVVCAEVSIIIHIGADLRLNEKLRWMNEEMLEVLRPILLSRHPNSYCYSKCLAEQLLCEEGKLLPVVIIRPSLVLSAYKEPYEGWIDGYNGITALIIAISKGLIKTIFHPSKKLDIVPVDYCVNLILASAWHISSHSAGPLVVYNCSTDTINSAWQKGNGTEPLWTAPSSLPPTQFYRRPSVTVANSKVLHEIHNIFSHLIPAVFLDICLLITGKNSRMVSQYKKLRAISKDFEFFFSNEWNFHTENVNVLLKSMDKADKKVFDVDVRNIKWDNYFEFFQLNIRENFLKDHPSTLKSARRSVKRWYYATVGIYIAAFGVLLYALRKDTWNIFTFLY